VRDVLSLKSPKLRIYLVWVPMLDGDNAEVARLEASLYQDRRIAHYWDEGGKLMTEMGRTLGLPQAWDVYILYDKKAKAPTFWMHQLDGVKAAPWLDSMKLRGKVEDLLGG
jgi:hypothetical protein